MLNRTTNRIRPTLDALEAREVCTTLIELGTISHLARDGHHALLSPAMVSTNQPKMTADLNAAAADLAGKPAPHLNVAYSVISIRNATHQTLRFTLQWSGSTAIETCSILPGQTGTFSIRQVEVYRKLTATIRFDQGPAATQPSKVYHLTSALLPESANGGAPSGLGREYAARPSQGGVALFPG